MKPLAKGLLIGCGTIVLLGVVTIGAIVWYFRTHGDELMAQGRAVEEEGIRAGEGATGAACVDAGFDRFRREGGGISGGVKARIFLQACLESSEADAAFCANVPRETDFTRSVTWRMAQCQSRGLGSDSACGSLLTGVQHFCENHGGAAPAVE